MIRTIVTQTLALAGFVTAGITVGQVHYEPPDPCFGTCKVRPAVSEPQDAPTYTVLYTFSGGTDGGYPQYGRLIADAAGNLYGTATFGGDVNCPILTSPGPGCGVVFKLA